MPRSTRTRIDIIAKLKVQKKIKKCRETLIERIEEQKNFANSIFNGIPYAKFRTLWRTKRTGERVSYQREIKIKPWWWKDRNDRYFLQIWYDHKVVPLADGSRTIDIGKSENLIDTLNKIIAVVNEGAFDMTLLTTRDTGKLDYYLSMTGADLVREKSGLPPRKPILIKNLDFLKPGLRKKMLRVIEKYNYQDPTVQPATYSIAQLTSGPDETRKDQLKIEHSRKILINRIEEQIDLANETLYGIKSNVAKPGKRYDDNGKLVSRQKAFWHEPWWVMEKDRRVYMEVRFKNRVLPLPNGDTRINVGGLNMVIEQLYGLIDAVNDGQFDDSVKYSYDNSELQELLTLSPKAVRQKKLDLESEARRRFEERQAEAMRRRDLKPSRKNWRRSEPDDD